MKFKTTIIQSVILPLLFIGLLFYAACNDKPEEKLRKEIGNSELRSGITLTILYDTFPFLDGLKHDWGFSCLIQRRNENIIFDTGTYGDILLDNMKFLGIKPADIDSAVISHQHIDHYLGIETLLEKNNRIKTYFLDSFPDLFFTKCRNSGAAVIPVKDIREIAKDIFTTGRTLWDYHEQAIIIKTGKGIVLIAGCAHPGIDVMVNAVKKITKQRVFLVAGGFHFYEDPEPLIIPVIENLKNAGVAYVAPCHCTGKIGLRLLEENFKECYIRTGAGRKIDPDLLR